MKGTDEKHLAWSILITLVIFTGEVIGGILSNSLALLSDAGHVFTDTFALGLSLIAIYVVRRPSDYRATYGYQRIGILAALINGCTLVVIAVLIFIETYKRFQRPPAIDSDVMLIVASAGLMGNLVMMWVLGSGHTNLNIKSAWLHVVGDTLSSGAVIVAGLLIKLTNWRFIDPIVSAVVGLIIIVGGWRVIKGSLWIFLELSPLGFHAGEISNMLLEIEDVRGVHDVHVWSIGHGIPAFSAHILIEDQKISETDRIRRGIESKLAELGIRHTVIQMECAECEANGLFCHIPNHEDTGEHGHRH